MVCPDCAETMVPTGEFNRKVLWFCPGVRTVREVDGMMALGFYAKPADARRMVGETRTCGTTIMS